MRLAGYTRPLPDGRGSVEIERIMIKSLHDSWLPRAWRKFRAVWTQGLRQQVTGTGIAYTAALAVVGTGAFISANNLLFLIFAAMLSTLLVSGFISRLGSPASKSICWSRSIFPHEDGCGRGFECAI